MKRWEFLGFKYKFINLAVPNLMNLIICLSEILNTKIQNRVFGTK